MNPSSKNVTGWWAVGGEKDTCQERGETEKRLTWKQDQDHLKKLKNESILSLLLNVSICPALIPLLDICFLLTYLYVKLLPSFQCISHPITFLRMGSSSNSGLGTSYLLINNSSVKYFLVLISKVKRNSNPVLSSKSQQVT